MIAFAFFIALVTPQDVHCSEQELLAQDVDSAAVFYPNRPMVMGEDRLLTAVPNNTSSPPVVLYEKDSQDGTWGLVADFPVPPGSSSEYGKPYALGADQVFVSDHKWMNATGQEQGRIHIFTRDPATGDWNLNQFIESPTPGWARFGIDFKVHGDRMAVWQTIGLARVSFFRRDSVSGLWTFEQSINGNSPSGHVIGLDGDIGEETFVVTSKLVTDDYLEFYGLGAGGAWTLEQRVATQPLGIFTPDAATILQEEVVVADPHSFGPGGVSFGSINFFRKNSATGIWGVAQTLNIFNFESNPVIAQDEFSNFAVEENLILIGNPRYGALSDGRVFLARRDVSSGTWAPTGELTPSPQTMVDQWMLGAAVAAHKEQVAVFVEPDFFSPNSTSRIWVLELEDCDDNGSSDACEIASDPQGLDCNSNGQLDTCEIAANPALDSDNDGMLDECCFLMNYCPGAANSVSPGGATLSLQGSPSLSGNQFRLVGQQVPPNEFALFLMGEAAIAGSLPAVGDGFLCISPFNRMHPVAATGSSGTPTKLLEFGSLCSFANGLPGATCSSPVDLIGQSFHFQFWYRDHGVPQGTGSNLSEALRVTFCQ